VPSISPFDGLRANGKLNFKAENPFVRSVTQSMTDPRRLIPRVWWLGLGGCQCALLLVLCLLPLPALPGNEWSWSDKDYHALAFACLMAWFAVATPRGGWWRVALTLLGFGIVIECAQSFVPYRSASAGDVLADLAGIALGTWVASVLPAGFPPLCPAK